MRCVRVGRIKMKEGARARSGGNERVGVLRRVRLVEFDVEVDVVKREENKRRTSGERIGSWRV